MRKYLFIFFILMPVFFAQAGIFNNISDREIFIEEAVVALNKKYIKNLELERTGNATASDYVVDIRNLAHQKAHALEGGDLAALNTVLARIKTTHSTEGVAVYVLLSTSQQHYMSNATDGYTDNTYFTQYLNQVKTITRADWYGLPQYKFDKYYDDYKAALLAITKEIMDRSQLGIQTKKGALLHIFGKIHIEKKSNIAGLSIKYLYNPVIALGQDLRAASMQSMLAYINTQTASILFSDPGKLYDPAQPNNGIINPYVKILEDGFAMLVSNSFVADENNLSMDAKLVNYRQPLDMTRVINGLNTAPINLNPTAIVKIDNGVTYTVIDYAGIISADAANFWTEFLKTSDINNGIGIKEINEEIAKVNYYIIITSDKNKHDEKVATQLVVESSLNNPMPNTILVGMHFRNNQTSHDLPVQYTCKYSSQLATKITSLRKDNGYSWYRNTVTGETVLGKYLSFTQSEGGMPQATDWVPLGLNPYVNPFNGQNFYTQYVNNPIVDYILVGVDRSFNALDRYMMKNGELVGTIIIECAITGATGGVSLYWTGARIIAYQGAKKVSKEVGKGALIAYTINVGLNMIVTDYGVGQADYNNDVFNVGIDFIGVVTAGVEEIYKDETSKALINCVGGFSSEAIKENVQILDLPEGCLRNVTTYYLTARLFGSGGAAPIVINKLKAAYAKNPIRFITRLKGYFNFTNDQVKALLTKLGIGNDGVVDNLGKLVLAAGKQYSKEALFIITKASTVTNEVIGDSWKFYTTTAKNKVFAEINTNGDLIIKDFSTVNFTGSSDDIIRSANYTNPSGQIESADIAFVTNSNGTSGITKKVVSSVQDILSRIKERPILYTEYNKMTTSLQNNFRVDFANSTDDLLNSFNKTDSELLSGWKRFRTKYASAVSCN